MISVRSAMSRSIIGGRSSPNAGSAFLQASLPFPSSSDESRTNNSSPFVRHMTSPAYKRYLKKQQVPKGHVRGLKPSIGAIRPGIQVPNLHIAKDMGKSFSEMENEPLQVIAEMGNHNARYEVLKRHIMAVDEVNYAEAEKTMQKVVEKCKEGLFMYALPYRIGIAIALISGIGAIPMVFDLNTATVFNDKFVTMEYPQPSDLDTILETGAWTWNWMEPLTGTLSFSLLTLQYARQQLLNLGVKPFTGRVLSSRSNKLIRAFPNYNERLLSNFVESYPMHGRN